MYRSSSRQPYWPGVQVNRNPHGQPEAEGGKDAGTSESVNEFLLKEQETLAGTKNQASGVSQKREPDVARANREAAPSPKATDDGKDDSDRKTKPGNGNVAIVATVVVLGVAGFMLGKAVVAGVQLLAPASSTVRAKMKPEAPSEYAETMRQYRQQISGDALADELELDAAGEEPSAAQPQDGQ